MLAKFLGDLGLRFLRILPPELSHNVALCFLRLYGGLNSCLWGVGLCRPRGFRGDFEASARAREVFKNGRIANAVGVAAGLDKDGVAIKGLLDCGFGFVEIGTVTPNPQKGNEKPRVFRIKSDGGYSVINSMGFPGRGADYVLKKLERFNKIKRDWQVVGVNIGRNKDSDESDYASLVRDFAGKCDYLAINVSSPNTVGLRKLLEPHNLRRLLLGVNESRSESANPAIPIMLKLSPDIPSEDLESVVLVAYECGIRGLIVSNTTVSRTGLPKESGHADRPGGLSGHLLKSLAVDTLESVVRINRNKCAGSLLLISVGGIDSKDGIAKRLGMGADLVQIYTGLTAKGMRFWC